MVAPLWQSQAESVVLDMLSYARLSSLGAYRAEMDKRLDFYETLQEEHTRQEMRKVFPRTWKLIRPEIFPRMTRMVVDETAQVYWQRPKRSLISQDGEEAQPDSPAQQRWDELVRIGLLDSTCRRVNRLTRLYRTAFLWVRYDIDNDALRFQVLHPQSVWVQESELYPGDISRADLVVIPLEQRASSPSVTSADMSQYWALSTEDAVRFEGYVTDVGGVEVVKVLEGPIPTPQPLLGRIPIVACHDEQASGKLYLDYDGGVVLQSSIVTMNLEANLALTDLRHLVRRQAAGQLIWSSATKPPANLVLSPDTILHNRDTSGSIGFANPGAQIPAVLDELKWLVKTMASMERISPGALATERRELSGYAMMLENLPLVRFTSEQQEHYSETFEYELFEMAKLVLAAYSKNKLPLDIRQRVKFVPLDYPADPAAEWSVAKEKMEVGIISPIDLIMRDNPGMTREEAQQRYQENRALSQAQQRPAGGRFGLLVRGRQQ